MRLLRSLLFLFITSMGCSASLIGQTSVSPTAMPERVTLRFLALEGRISGLTVQGPGEQITLDIRSTRFTRDIVTTVREGRVSLVEKAPADEISQNGAPAKVQPAASFEVTPGINRYLIVLIPAGSGRFQLHVQPDNAEILPAGHVRVLNFTPRPVAIQLGAGQATISPDNSVVLACPPDENNAVRLKLASLTAPDQWELVASTRLSVSARHRQFLIITPSRPQRHVPGAPAVAEGGPLETRLVFDSLLTPTTDS